MTQKHSEIRAFLRLGLLATTILLLSACAASPEVKQASSDVGVALKELQSSRRAFQVSYLAELDEIQRLIMSSILADAVNREIGAMVDEGFDGDLIQLSDSIKDKRVAAQSRITLVIKKLPFNGTDSEAFVLSALRSAAPKSRSLADALESTDPEEARVLRERADLLDNHPRAGVHEEELEALMSLVELENTKSGIKEGLKDLGDYVTLLQMIQKQVNEWVVTDVKVEGEELAKFFDRVAALSQSEGGS